MQITMTAAMEGPGVSRSVGQTVEVSDKEAIRLINAGFAVPVREERNVETATKARGKKKKA